MPPVINVADNLALILKQIADCAQEFGRSADEVKLLAVSKTKPVSSIKEAIAAGQKSFGENYLQDALPKIVELKDSSIDWHFIGHLQSNKAKQVAENFSWVETVDSEKVAKKLNDHRPSDLLPLNVCVQVNISNEFQKGGVKPGDCLSLARYISSLPMLKLRGVMAIASNSGDFEIQCQEFAKAQQEFVKLKNNFSGIDTLSIGMSQDLRAAIKCGSTCVRVGTAIFGAR